MCHIVIEIGDIPDGRAGAFYVGPTLRLRYPLPVEGSIIVAVIAGKRKLLYFDKIFCRNPGPPRAADNTSIEFTMEYEPTLSTLVGGWARGNASNSRTIQ